MESIQSAFGKELEWIQPKISGRTFELRYGDEVYGILSFDSAFGSRATAETSDESWTFKRVGFFKTRVTVRHLGEETDLAVYQPRWSGTEGTIQLVGSRSYQWKTANFWATEYQVLDSLGKPVLVFKSGVENAGFSGLFKRQARMEIDPAYFNLPELALLIMLGWYLMILKQDDDSAAVAAATASTY